MKAGSEDAKVLYRSCYLVRMISFMILRWTGHVARMGEDKTAFHILTPKPNEKNVYKMLRCKIKDRMTEITMVNIVGEY